MKGGELMGYERPTIVIYEDSDVEVTGYGASYTS